MSHLRELPFTSVQFYTTAPYPCSYVSDRMARSQVATPTHLIGNPLYGDLVRNGFRRSGVFTYRPHCDGCRACVPVRIPALQYQPNRSQQRAQRRHQKQLTALAAPLAFSEEHYALYLAYQSGRHPGGGMDQDSREQYSQFLLQSQVDTQLIEFRDANDILKMISIIDLLADGLSSVYTYYALDPGASYGSYSILWQLARCRDLDLPYLYLGYWIQQSDKMNYKARFQPIEALHEGQWLALQPA